LAALHLEVPSTRDGKRPAVGAYIVVHGLGGGGFAGGGGGAVRGSSGSTSSGGDKKI
jgi:hypothetical protein